MSIRYLGSRILRHGREYVRHICRREYNTTNISADKINVVQSTNVPSLSLGHASSSNAHIVQRTSALRNVGVQVGLHARRILIDNVLNRVTNSLSGELRKKATKKLVYIHICKRHQVK